jgi:anti-sigma B factor antagonist
VGATWSVESMSDGNVRVQIRGEVDLAAEALLVEQVAALAESEEAAIILLDLTAVEFLDSSGIRALLRIHREHGDRVQVVAVSRPVRRVLDIAGLGLDLGLDTTEATSNRGAEDASGVVETQRDVAEDASGVETQRDVAEGRAAG